MTPEQLKQWRTDHSLTQKDLGRLLGVTKTCVYRWEAGLRNLPSFLHLALECLGGKGGIDKERARMKKEKGGDK